MLPRQAALVTPTGGFSLRRGGPREPVEVGAVSFKVGESSNKTSGLRLAQAKRGLVAYGEGVRRALCLLAAASALAAFGRAAAAEEIRIARRIPWAGDRSS